MKKIIVAFAMLLLIGTVFTFVPVAHAPNPTFNIGVIGPQGLPHWGGPLPIPLAGMWPAAQLAALEINAAGGVNVGGTYYDINLVPGNEYAVTGPGGTPEPSKAAAEVVDLITNHQVKFFIGGFRTECAGPMIEKAMDYQVPFFIDGAATNALIHNLTDPTTRARYQYVYRVTPTNDTILVSTLCAFMKMRVLPYILLPLYGDYLWPGAPNKQVRVAVLAENLTWTSQLFYALTHMPYEAMYLGPYANVTYAALVNPTDPTSVPGILSNVNASGARLMIHIFSAPIGQTVIAKWSELGVQALPVGINVMSQLETYWNTTIPSPRYECILDTWGTRTPYNSLTTAFWDHFVGNYSAWPIYTAEGAYDGIYGIKDALERAGINALNYITGASGASVLTTYFESTDRTVCTGRFRYTPWHDVYVSPSDLGHYYLGNARAVVVQWQSAGAVAGRKEVVWPNMSTWSRAVRLPAVMYPKLTDINYDGKVDIKDVAAAAKAFGSYPGSPNWNMAADLDNNGAIDIKDVAKIAKDFGWKANLPLP